MTKTIEENKQFISITIMLQNHLKAIIASLLIILLADANMNACTGIRLLAKNGGVVYGRTMEWGAYDLHSRVLIIPRNYQFKALTTDGLHGKSYATKYGVVGLDALKTNFISDGMNEKGLAIGLFYHSGYARYPAYIPKDSSQTISSLDVTNYILSQFASVEEVKKGMAKVTVVLPPDIPGVQGAVYDFHWMVTDTTGASIVIEFRDQQMVVYDNPLGVITNNPYYDWHMTNLANYINLSEKPFSSKKMRNTVHGDSLYIKPLGAGTGMLGVPGDYTPPSRFIRAVAWTQTARPLTSAEEAVYETFRILDSFQLPAAPGSSEGSDSNDQKTTGMRSGTQWTTAWNLTDRILNYHTQNNRRVRFLDLKKVSFTTPEGEKPKIRYIPVDAVKEQDKQDITPKS